jgi:hypothetical protein
MKLVKGQAETHLAAAVQSPAPLQEVNLDLRCPGRQHLIAAGNASNKHTVFCESKAASTECRQGNRKRSKHAHNWHQGIRQQQGAACMRAALRHSDECRAAVRRSVGPCNPAAAGSRGSFILQCKQADSSARDSSCAHLAGALSPRAAGPAIHEAHASSKVDRNKTPSVCFP